MMEDTLFMDLSHLTETLWTWNKQKKHREKDMLRNIVFHRQNSSSYLENLKQRVNEIAVLN